MTGASSSEPHSRGTQGRATLLAVRVQPNAKKPGIQVDESGQIRVRVSEPPVDSKANLAVTKTLAKLLKVPKSAVRLARGDKSRDKIFAINGLSESQLRERLESSLTQNSTTQ